MWLNNNLNMQMTPYQVVCSGNNIGYVQFVYPSKELCKVHKLYGNWWSAEQSVVRFCEEEGFKLIPERESNITASKLHDEKKKYQEVYIRSTAGYCVSSYVLGLGDRHSGNIML